MKGAGGILLALGCAGVGAGVGGHRVSLRRPRRQPQPTSASASRRARCTVVSQHRPARGHGVPPAPAAARRQRAPADPPARSPAAARSTGSRASRAKPQAHAPTATARFLRMGSTVTYSYIDATACATTATGGPRAWPASRSTRVNSRSSDRELLRLRRVARRQFRHDPAQHRRPIASEIAAPRRQFGVEEAVVRAIIHAESAYDPTRCRGSARRA